MNEASPRRLRLDDQLCFALYAATNAVTRAYRPLLAELKLTYPQYLVMLVLWQDGPSAVRHIAARLQLGPSAIVPLVDHLEAAGFVVRRRDSADRRLTHIVPTDAGRALEHAAALAQEVVACRTGLTDEGLAELREELHQMVDRMTADIEHVAQPRAPERPPLDTHDR